MRATDMNAVALAIADEPNRDAARRIALALTDHLATRNAGFDLDRWYESCAIASNDQNDHPRCCNVCSQKLDSAYTTNETVCGACLDAFDREEASTNHHEGTAA
jgi:hypothetical protein